MIHQLNEKWKARLQATYNDDFEYFTHYDDVYGIARRLGFRDAKEAWEVNPIIQGSVDPKDFKVAKSFKRNTASRKPYHPNDDWKMRQANDDTFRESKQLNEALPFARHLEVEAIQVNTSVNKGVTFAKNGKFYEAMEEFKWAINLLEGCIRDAEKEGNK